jgi:fructokinase
VNYFIPIFVKKTMVYTLGEMLLDVDTEKEIPRKEYLIHGHPGGAMLNAAVSLARSGVPTTLISESGDDKIGRYLLRFLENNGVTTRYIRQYAGHPTSVALARLDKDKKPVYSFRKHYPERRSLLSPGRFTGNDILLFGSLYALDTAIRKEIVKIITAARASGTTILYDPNIRMAEQLSDEAHKKVLFENLKAAHIIKGSDEDFHAVFGHQTPEKHVSALQAINPEALIFLTLGAKGALAAWKKQRAVLPAQKVKVVSTIGAGDGFNAGLIAKIVTGKFRFSELPAHLEAFLENGIAFSAAVCGSKDNYIPDNGINL